MPHQKGIIHIFLPVILVAGIIGVVLLNNYHPNEETGNSFTYPSTNPWDIFMALVRAHETYRFPYDWQHIVRGVFRTRIL